MIFAIRILHSYTGEYYVKFNAEKYINFNHS
jgi:hypothetical protein